LPAEERDPLELIVRVASVRQLYSVDVCNLALIGLQLAQTFTPQEFLESSYLVLEAIRYRLVPRVFIRIPLAPIMNNSIVLNLHQMRSARLLEPEAGGWRLRVGSESERCLRGHSAAPECLELWRQRRFLRGYGVFTPKFRPEQAGVYVTETGYGIELYGKRHFCYWRLVEVR